MFNYNLSFYEIGARYVMAILVLIPAAMLFQPAIIIGGVYLIVTALLGMCPVKAIFFKSKAVSKQDKQVVKTSINPNKNIAA